MAIASFACLSVCSFVFVRSIRVLFITVFIQTVQSIGAIVAISPLLLLCVFAVHHCVETVQSIGAIVAISPLLLFCVFVVHHCAETFLSTGALLLQCVFAVHHCADTVQSIQQAVSWLYRLLRCSVCLTAIVAVSPLTLLCLSDCYRGCMASDVALSV